MPEYQSLFESGGKFYQIYHKFNHSFITPQLRELFYLFSLRYPLFEREDSESCRQEGQRNWHQIGVQYRVGAGLVHVHL